MVGGFGLTTTKEKGEESKKPTQSEESKKPVRPLEVFISYFQSPKDPDIFKIKIEEGQL